MQSIFPLKILSAPLASVKKKFLHKPILQPPPSSSKVKWSTSMSYVLTHIIPQSTAQACYLVCEFVMHLISWWMRTFCKSDHLLHFYFELLLSCYYSVVWTVAVINWRRDKQRLSGQTQDVGSCHLTTIEHFHLETGITWEITGSIHVCWV